MWQPIPNPIIAEKSTLDPDMNYIAISDNSKSLIIIVLETQSSHQKS
jgi:hypothetical protein